jgi:hypothetical protein
MLSVPGKYLRYVHHDPELLSAKYKIYEEMLGKFVTNARQTPVTIKHKALYSTPKPRTSLLLYYIFEILFPSKVTD